MQRGSGRKIVHVCWSSLSTTFPDSRAAFPCHDPPFLFLLMVAWGVTWHKGVVAMRTLSWLDDTRRKDEMRSQVKTRSSLMAASWQKMSFTRVYASGELWCHPCSQHLLLPLSLAGSPCPLVEIPDRQRILRLFYSRRGLKLSHTCEFGSCWQLCLPPFREEMQKKLVFRATQEQSTSTQVRGRKSNLNCPPRGATRQLQTRTFLPCRSVPRVVSQASEWDQPTVGGVPVLTQQSTGI